MTNSISFLPEVDEIIMLKRGAIIGLGTYDYLIENNQEFAKFATNSFGLNQIDADLVDTNEEKKELQAFSS